MSRSSGGRSAVSTINGTRAWWASITAGAKLAAAVPDVQVSATGRPDALAAPSAKNPAQRSSICDQHAIRGSRTSDRTIGVLREPGEVQACCIPHRASSSHSARSSRWETVAVMMESMPESLVLLHGFTQTGASWDGVAAELAERYRPLAPDLRGHGSASNAVPVDLGAVLGDIAALAPPAFTVVGYSMGGRIALHLALAIPQRIARLVLIGASPGISDPVLRQARRDADERLAQEIERGSIDQFAHRWAQTPVLSGRPPAVAAAAHADRLHSTPAGPARPPRRA